MGKTTNGHRRGFLRSTFRVRLDQFFAAQARFFRAGLAVFYSGVCWLRMYCLSVSSVALPSLAGEGRHGRSVHVAGPAGHRRHEPLSRKNKRARRAMPVAPQWGPHTIGIVKSTRVQHVQYTTTRRPTVGKSQWVREPWPPPIAVVRSTVLTSDLMEPKKASSRLPDPGTTGGRLPVFSGRPPVSSVRGQIPAFRTS